MDAIVTIFKSEFKDKPDVFTDLNAICPNVQQVDDAYIVKPTPGTLFEILNFLKQNKINYGTLFDTHPVRKDTQDKNS